MTEHQTEEFIGGASFSRLFEEMYDPALLFQVDTGTILFANSSARTLLEYDQSEITSVTASGPLIGVFGHNQHHSSGFAANL